ncbi:MAG: OmpA family protein [Pseudomonadota bacterium]|nr:OmpA family protein [Pseudomonadota bacterium]
MLTVFMMLACVGKGKFDALQVDLDRTRTELAAAASERTSLAEALAAETARSQALTAERARLISDASVLKGSVTEMEAALRELAERKAASDARIAEYKSLLARFQPLIDSGKLKVKIVDGRMVVELATDILFSSGSAELSPAGKTAIIDVSKVLASIPERDFQVEGHTDDLPIKTSQYPSNWELAAGRSLTVVKTMIEAGLPTSRVSVASFGSEHPVTANTSDAARAANRRIEIVVVPDLSSLPGFEELKRAANP